MISEDHWTRTRQEFPLGKVVRGVVADVFGWGFTVQLGWGENEITEALVDVVSYRPEGEVVQPEQFPAPGFEIEGRVADHVDFNRRIKLSVGVNDLSSVLEEPRSESSQ